MAISATVGWPPGSDKPSLQLVVPAEDAVALVAELGSLLKGEFTPAQQLQALHDIITANLPKP